MTNFETDVLDVLDVLHVRGGWFIHSGSTHFCMYNSRAAGCLKFAGYEIRETQHLSELSTFAIGKI